MDGKMQKIKNVSIVGYQYMKNVAEDSHDVIIQRMNTPITGTVL